MAEMAINAGRRVMHPGTVLLAVLIGFGALALGFGVRAWTESAPKHPVPVVVSRTSGDSLWQWPCRAPRPC
jgi:hypothetical protein